MTEYRKTSTCPCSKMPSSAESPGCACSKREEIKGIRITSKEDGFNPQLYNFRLQQLNSGPRVHAPPFHVQLDHTIAVLWYLYNKSTTNPDVGHLQWAKHFLQRIRNNHGDMPKDVETVVKAIEDRMLSMYAALSAKSSFKVKTCCSKEPHTCQAKQSVTFTEMMKQKPTEVVEQLFCIEKVGPCESCSSHLACECQTSKEDMAKYLKQQRAERVRIIHAELKRLQEIDQFMGNVGESSTDIVDGNALKQIESGKEITPVRKESAEEREEVRAPQSPLKPVRRTPSGREVPEGKLVDI